MHAYELTQVYLHNVCMFHAFVCGCPSVSQTVVQHLLGTCHSPLHSSSHSIKVTSLCSVPEEPGILPTEQTTQQQSTAELSLIKRYKRYEIQCVITEPHSFQNQRERQLKKASVSTELSLALWLKPWQPSVSGKIPLALRQSAAACWAGQLRDGLQQTHEQTGCPSQMRYGEFSGKAANIC